MLVKSKLVRRLGASLVEYALLVGLIAVVCIAAVMLFGQEVSALFSRIAASVESISQPADDGKGKGNN